MFNLGFSELIVLAIIGLLVLGPEQLPVVARKVARALNQLKSVVDEAMQPGQEIQQQAKLETEKFESSINESIDKSESNEPK